MPSPSKQWTSTTVRKRVVVPLITALLLIAVLVALGIIMLAARQEEEALTQRQQQEEVLTSDIRLAKSDGSDDYGTLYQFANDNTSKSLADTKQVASTPTLTMAPPVTVATTVSTIYKSAAGIQIQRIPLDSTQLADSDSAPQHHEKKATLTAALSPLTKPLLILPSYLERSRPNAVRQLRNLLAFTEEQNRATTTPTRPREMQRDDDDSRSDAVENPIPFPQWYILTNRRPRAPPSWRKRGGARIRSSSGPPRLRPTVMKSAYYCADAMRPSRPRTALASGRHNDENEEEGADCEWYFTNIVPLHGQEEEASFSARDTNSNNMKKSPHSSSSSSSSASTSSPSSFQWISTLFERQTVDLFQQRVGLDIRDKGRVTEALGALLARYSGGKPEGERGEGEEESPSEQRQRGEGTAPTQRLGRPLPLLSDRFSVEQIESLRDLLAATYVPSSTATSAHPQHHHGLAVTPDSFYRLVTASYRVEVPIHNDWMKKGGFRLSGAALRVTPFHVLEESLMVSTRVDKGNDENGNASSSHSSSSPADLAPHRYKPFVMFEGPIDPNYPHRRHYHGRGANRDQEKAKQKEEEAQRNARRLKKHVLDHLLPLARLDGAGKNRKVIPSGNDPEEPRRREEEEEGLFTPMPLQPLDLPTFSGNPPSPAQEYHHLSRTSPSLIHLLAHESFNYFADGEQRAYHYKDDTDDDHSSPSASTTKTASPFVSPPRNILNNNELRYLSKRRNELEKKKRKNERKGAQNTKKSSEGADGEFEEEPITLHIDSYVADVRANTDFYRRYSTMTGHLVSLQQSIWGDSAAPATNALATNTTNARNAEARRVKNGNKMKKSNQQQRLEDGLLASINVPPPITPSTDVWPATQGNPISSAAADPLGFLAKSPPVYGVGQIALTLTNRIVRLSPSVNDFYGKVIEEGMLMGVHGNDENTTTEHGADEGSHQRADMSTKSLDDNGIILEGLLAHAPPLLTTSSTDAINGHWNRSDVPSWLVLPSFVNVGTCFDGTQSRERQVSEGGTRGEDHLERGAGGKHTKRTRRKSILIIGSSHARNMYSSLCTAYIGSRVRALQRRLRTQRRQHRHWATNSSRSSPPSHGSTQVAGYALQRISGLCQVFDDGGLAAISLATVSLRRWEINAMLEEALGAGMKKNRSPPANRHDDGVGHHAANDADGLSPRDDEESIRSDEGEHQQPFPLAMVMLSVGPFDAIEAMAKHLTDEIGRMEQVQKRRFKTASEAIQNRKKAPPSTSNSNIGSLLTSDSYDLTPRSHKDDAFLLTEMFKHLPQFSERVVGSHQAQMQLESDRDDENRRTREVNTSNTTPPKMQTPPFMLSDFLLRARSEHLRGKLRGLFSHVLYVPGTWEVGTMDPSLPEETENTALILDLIEEVFAPTEKIILYNPHTYQLHPSTEISGTDDPFREAYDDAFPSVFHSHEDDDGGGINHQNGEKKTNRNESPLSRSQGPSALPLSSEDRFKFPHCSSPHRRARLRDAHLCAVSPSTRQRVRDAWQHRLATTTTTATSQVYGDAKNWQNSSLAREGREGVPMQSITFTSSSSSLFPRVPVEVFDPAGYTTQLAALFVDDAGHHYRQGAMEAIGQRLLRDHVCPPRYVMGVAAHNMKEGGGRLGVYFAATSEDGDRDAAREGQSTTYIDYANSLLPRELPNTSTTASNGQQEHFIKVITSNEDDAMEMPSLTTITNSGHNDEQYAIRHLFPLFKLPTARVTEGLCRAIFDHPYADINRGVRAVQRRMRSRSHHSNRNRGIPSSAVDRPQSRTWWSNTIGAHNNSDGAKPPPPLPFQSPTTSVYDGSLFFPLTHDSVVPSRSPILLGSLNAMSPYLVCPWCAGRRPQRLLRSGASVEALKSLANATKATERGEGKHEARRKGWDNYHQRLLAAVGLRGASFAADQPAFVLDPGHPQHAALSFPLFKTTRHNPDPFLLLRTLDQATGRHQTRDISCRRSPYMDGTHNEIIPAVANASSEERSDAQLMDKDNTGGAKKTTEEEQKKWTAYLDQNRDSGSAYPAYPLPFPMESLTAPAFFGVTGCVEPFIEELQGRMTVDAFMQKSLTNRKKMQNKRGHQKVLN